MKTRRKLKKWVEVLLMCIDVIVIIFLLSINEFNNVTAYIVAWIVGIAILLFNHYVLSTYGSIFDDEE